MSDTYSAPQADPWAGFSDQPPLRVTVRPQGAAQSDPWAAFSDQPPPKAEISAAPKVAPSQSIAIGYENQGSAAGQGTTPDIGAHQQNLISSDTYQNDAGDVLYKDPMTGAVVPTDKNKHVVLRDPADNTVKVFQRTPSTDEGRLSAAGRLAIMGMGPSAAGSRPAQLASSVDAARAAENIGVDLPKVIATDNPFARFLGQATAQAPGGGPLQEGIKTAVGQTENAVGRAAEMAGGSTDPAVSGANFRQGIETYFKPGVKSRIDEAYTQVGKVTDPNIRTPLDSTQGAIADITARRQASGEEDIGKAVKTVLGGATRPGGLTFEGVKDLRTRVGEMLDTGVFPEGMSQGELRRIYGSLSDDLQSAARNAGGDRAVAALARANTMNKVVSDWKDSLGKVLGTDKRADEGVAGSIIRLAGNGPSADLTTLAKARAAVPKEVWQDVASTAINNLGRSRTGEWSPAAYRTDFNALSDRGKSLLFASVGERDLVPFLSDIAKVSNKFVEAGKAANTSKTAATGALYSAAIYALNGIMNGRLREPLQVLGAVAGVNVMSRLLATKATAASMARWSRAYDAVAGNTSPRTIATFNIATRNLANTLNGHLGGHITPQDIFRSISGPVRAPAEQEQP